MLHISSKENDCFSCSTLSFHVCLQAGINNLITIDLFVVSNASSGLNGLIGYKQEYKVIRYV